VKKIGAVGLIVLGFSIQSNAQAFQNKDNIITLGFGFDPYYKHFSSYGHNVTKKTGIGPIMVSYERGITEKLGIGRIGVGGAIGQSFYTTKSYDFFNYEYVERISRTAIFVKAAYHFDFGIDKLDVYAGVGGGVYVRSETHSSTNQNASYVNKNGSVLGGPAVFGGVRYCFTKNFGVYGEVGYGMCAINGGVVFKF